MIWSNQIGSKFYWSNLCWAKLNPDKNIFKLLLTQSAFLFLNTFLPYEIQITVVFGLQKLVISFKAGWQSSSAKAMGQIQNHLSFALWYTEGIFNISSSIFDGAELLLTKPVIFGISSKEQTASGRENESGPWKLCVKGKRTSLKFPCCQVTTKQWDWMKHGWFKVENTVLIPLHILLPTTPMISLLHCSGRISCSAWGESVMQYGSEDKCSNYYQPLAAP